MATINVMEQYTDLTMAQSKKAYAVVVLRPMPLTTTGGLYVRFMRVETTTDDIERAKRDLHHAGGGPGVLAFVVDIATSRVVL